MWATRMAGKRSVALREFKERLAVSILPDRSNRPMPEGNFGKDSVSRIDKGKRSKPHDYKKVSRTRTTPFTAQRATCA
jgi:hypothetical protein